MRALADQAARHHVVALNAVHGRQNAWQNGRVALQVRVRLRLIQAPLVLARIDRVLLQDPRRLIVRKSDRVRTVLQVT